MDTICFDDFEFDARTLEVKDEGGGQGNGDQRDDADVAAAVERMQAAFDAKMATVDRDLKAATDRADALELKVNRPSGAARRDAGPTPEQKAFNGFLRGGPDGLSPDERKTLRVADNTAGGFLAPDDWMAEIIRGVVQFSPVRAAARVGQTSAGAVVIPRRIGRLSAQWVGEIERRPDTEPKYGQLEITVHEMACQVPVSNQLLEDAAVDIAAELSFDFQEEFGRKEGEAFILGNGVKRPTGLLFDPAVPSVPYAKADINADTKFATALVSLMYSLPAFYRSRAAWMMSGPTIGFVRNLKDAQGRFLWQEGLAADRPPTLLGKPVVEAVDMPDPVAGNTPIAFGDFSSAYRIYDRVGLQVLRNPYVLADEGQTVFHARRRVGGGLVLPEAIRKLAIGA